jgi:hypothetical protein
VGLSLLMLVGMAFAVVGLMRETISVGVDLITLLILAYLLSQVAIVMAAASRKQFIRIPIKHYTNSMRVRSVLIGIRTGSFSLRSGYFDNQITGMGISGAIALGMAVGFVLFMLFAGSVWFVAALMS